MRWVQNLRALVVVVGWVAAVWGVGYAINGMTIAPAWVRAPVSVAPAPERYGWGNVQVEVPGVEVPDGWLAGARPGGWETTASGTWLSESAPDGALTIVAWGSTRAEQLLARGNWLVGGLGTLVGALALAPVLASIADGRPFAPGNARRLVVLAVTVTVAGLAAPVLPAVAGEMVLARTGLAGHQLQGAPPGSLAPLAVGLVVLAVAAAFRAGERMAADQRGLV